MGGINKREYYYAVPGYCRVIVKAKNRKKAQEKLKQLGYEAPIYKIRNYYY